MGMLRSVGNNLVTHSQLMPFPLYFSLLEKRSFVTYSNQHLLKVMFTSVASSLPETS